MEFRVGTRVLLRPTSKWSFQNKKDGIEYAGIIQESFASLSKEKCWVVRWDFEKRGTKFYSEADLVHTIDSETNESAKILLNAGDPFSGEDTW